MTKVLRTGWVCLLAIAAAGSAPAQTYHDNVVIILDGSGSMSDNMRQMPVSKMDAAKTALKDVLQNLPEGIDVGLLVFSTSVRRPWAYPLGPLDQAALEEAIDDVNSGGGTPLGRYIKLGADRLLEAREEQFGYGSYRLLVVTDGEATDPNEMDRNTPEVLSRGITVDVIGVDMATDHALAQLAHSYRRADDPESLEKAVADVFAEVGGTSADSADEDFEVLAGIPVEVAQAIIEGLATPNNAPIGENGYRQASSTASSSMPSHVVTNPPRQSSGSLRLNGFALVCMFVPIIALVLFISVIRAVARQSR